MVKSNYASWHIDPRQFPANGTDAEKLLFFARYGTLAPSGHNTQPWKISIHGESIRLSVNKAHYLSQDGSGLLSVEPWISLGTFVEMMSIAGRGFGYELDINHDSAASHVDFRIGKKVAAKTELLQAIMNRVSNRFFFKTTPLKPEATASLQRVSFPGVAFSLVQKPEDIRLVGELSELAVLSIMGNAKYRRELSEWVRTNFTSKYDGMPGFTHGFNAAVSLLSKRMVRHLLKHGPQAKHTKDLILNSGLLIIARSTEDTQESYLNLGRLYSRIAIELELHGYASSAVGASAIDPITREELKKHFNLNDRPVFVLRSGLATRRAAHSPRWPLEKLMK